MVRKNVLSLTLALVNGFILGAGIYYLTTNFPASLLLGVACCNLCHWFSTLLLYDLRS
jgi:NhaP-type Na+/H+ or K+/H+ antiporter